LESEVVVSQDDLLLALIDKLAGHRVLVVGDVILDEYLIGRTNRLSREAPVPVLEFERREIIPGGASNPAANAVRLGSAAIQVGVTGDDNNGTVLSELLRARGIDPSGLVVDSARQTTTKTRILAQMGLRYPQQVARIDRVDRHPVGGPVEREIVAQVRNLAAAVNAVMVSDYLNGLLTEEIVTAIRSICYDRGLLATVDAQSNLSKYAGFDVVKCNADEAARYVERDLVSDDDFALAGLSMAASLRLRGAMLITRGSAGITVARRDNRVSHIPAPKVEDVYDTVGAGDTVLAVMTLALLAGASHADAAALANLAAGIVVRKVGNYAPSPDDLRAVVKSLPG
jgi:rfaE bifunctional protein kinase chain/domain